VEHPLLSFRREMDRLFEDMWRGFEMPVLHRAGSGTGTLSPRIELKDRDDAVIVRAELPGLEEKDVEITLTEGALAIRGEKKLEKEEMEEGYTYSERSYGAFERRIPLETEVIGEKVTADFSNGVLTITLPKSQQAKSSARRIPIGGKTEAPAERTHAPAEQRAA